MNIFYIIGVVVVWNFAASLSEAAADTKARSAASIPRI